MMVQHIFKIKADNSY